MNVTRFQPPTASRHDLLRRAIVSAVALVILAATTARASVVLTPVMDAHVRSDQPGGNFVGSDALLIGKFADDPSTTYYRSYFQFDVSVLAPGTIQKAVIEVYAYDATGAGGMACGAHEVLGSWSDSSITWSTAPPHAAQSQSSTNVGGNLGWYTWNITALVQAWADGTKPNRGVVLMSEPESSAGVRRHGVFHSMESTIGLLPRLIVNGGTDTLPVTGITPNQAHIGDFVYEATISGASFTIGATARLTKAGSPSITGQDTYVSPDGSWLKTSFDLTDRPSGLWNVVVNNLSGAHGTLPNGFHIIGIPVPTGIAPAQGSNNATVHVTVTGSEFQPGLTAWLYHYLAPDTVHAQNVVVAGGGLSFTADFDLTNVPPGARNLYVANPDQGMGILWSSFTVLAAPQTPQVTSIDPALGGNIGPLGVTIHGDRFTPTVTALLRNAGQSDIVGTEVTVSPDRKTIVATLPLSGEPGGMRDVVVINSSGLSATLPHAFEVLSGIHLFGINPARGSNVGPVVVALAGMTLDPAAQVVLRRVGETDIVGHDTEVAPEGTTMTTTFELLDRVPGMWDVVVRNPDDAVAALPNGFEVQGGTLSAPSTDAARAPGFISIGPNPAKGSLRVEYAVARAGRARLLVSDVTGRQVAILADGPHTVGRHVATWAGASTAPMGIYFLRLDLLGARMTSRVVVAR